MIACLSKNNRAHRLFSELHLLDPRYVDLGTVRPGRPALFLSALSSLRPDPKRTKTDAYFSPVMRQEMERKCRAALESRPDAEAVVYWGATNSPVALLKKPMPYYIITDGPYDPNDPAYPIEWRPARWSKNYFARQRSIYSNAVHVFTLSEWARQKLLSVHDLKPENITTIGWGPMHTCEPNFQPSHPPYFLSLGSEWHRKGMDLVAEAAAILYKTRPDSVTRIVGDPKGFDVVAVPGVETTPHAVPGAEAQRLIAHATALIVASRFDASPHVIYEALQAGTPVIATDTCGTSEAIQLPRGGRVVPGGNAAALAAAMAELLAGNAEAQRKAAYETYLESGGWKACAHKLRAVVRS